MYPLNDFEAILSCDYCDTGDTGNEVLQRNTILQSVIAHLQRTEFGFITVYKTKNKTNTLLPL